jgi:hypothetical protein
MKREEIEQLVRSVRRVCKGPPVWSETVQNEYRVLLRDLDARGPEPELLAQCRRKIDEGKAAVERMTSREFVLPYPQKKDVLEVYADLIYLMRLHQSDLDKPCGYDIIELILADGVFDGSDRTVVCPQCGTMSTYSLKIE